MIKHFLRLIFVALALPVFPQDYSFKQYQLDDGLPTEIVKGSVQDSLGYFWIATDEGLVKYDGVTFTTYREPFHNNYIKGFFTSKNGRLFVFGDLDFIEIRNRGDSVIFNPILLGARAPGEHTLSYPKSIFEDAHGDIWISESQSVVRIHKNYFKRYNFDLTNRSPQFLRSFSFFEDGKHQLFVSSFPGNVFIFNSANDQFDAWDRKLPTGIEHLSMHNGQLLIGAADGFYKSALPAEGGFHKMELILKHPLISFIAPLPNQKYFIATRGVQQFVYDANAKSVSEIPFKINNINHVYLSTENDIWISSNDGLTLLREKLFHRASKVESEFIETVTEDPVAKNIFYATKNTLYSFDPEKGINKDLLTIPNGYFQSMVFAKEGLWVANAFKVFLLNHNSIINEFDFSDQVRFVTDLAKDSKNNLWISQTGNPSIYRIDSTRHLSQYKIPIGKDGVINVIREGKDGIYVASTGITSYLFYKPFEDSSFRNISVPVPFKPQGDFNITDIAFLNDTIWLASSEGLLKFDKHSIQPLAVDAKFDRVPVKTIKVYQEDKFLMVNAFGLMLFDPAKRTYNLFNESNGMVSNTITTRGLFLSRSKSVWVGTSKGLCYTPNSLSTSKKTPSPYIVRLLANGKHVHVPPQHELAYSSFISLTVSSITFPEKEVDYQYRLSPQKDWTEFKTSEISFSELRSGEFNLEIRAKKNGPFSWSDPTMLAFQIAKPLWQRAWFIIGCVLTAAFLVIISIVWANSQNTKRRKKLELLVEERTNALTISNEELSIRNDELDRFVYSASHDLSAPLKSILGLINVARMETTSQQTLMYLDLMNSSVLKLDSFIRDIIMYSRNARLPIKNEPIALSPLFESIWADHQFLPHVAKINFEIIDHTKSEFRSDETRFKIIFNNLISNAIKFHDVNTKQLPFIRIMVDELSNHFEFKIEDNGVGISPDYQDRIFEMFFRATETVQGSGLGLYILKETINKLNGTVAVESALGKGTIFTIRLPKKE